MREPTRGAGESEEDGMSRLGGRGGGHGGGRGGPRLSPPPAVRCMEGAGKRRQPQGPRPHAPRHVKRVRGHTCARAEGGLKCLRCPRRWLVMGGDLMCACVVVTTDELCRCSGRDA